MTKIKIIIIALFLIANAIWIYMYISSSGASRTLRADTMAQIGQTLSDSGITVTADTFPVIPSSMPLYNATNELSDKQSIANMVLGSDNYMLEPDHFQTKTQDLVVDGGRLDFLPVILDADTTNLLVTPQSFWAKLKVKSAMKSAGLWTSKSAILSTENASDSKQLIATVSDKLDGYDVVDSYAKIWVGREKTKDITDTTIVTKISGFNWLDTTYTKIPNSDVQLMSLTDILTKYAQGHDKTQPLTITAVDFGYLVGERAPDVVTKQVDIGLKITTDQGVAYISAIPNSTQ